MNRLLLGLIALTGLLSSLGVEEAIAFPDPEPRAIAQAAKPSLPAGMKPFDQVVKDTEKLDGLFTLYRDSTAGKLYLEVQPRQLNQTYLWISTLASGIGESGLYRGTPLVEFPLRLQRVQNKLHLIVPNTKVRNSSGDPAADRALAGSFSDSVLYALDIQSIHPDRQSLLVDLNDLLLNSNDIADFKTWMPLLLGAPYSLDRDKSYVSEVQAFQENLELETVQSFSGSGKDSNGNPTYIPTLPDSRGFSVRVRHSFSVLRSSPSFVPRLADERVGYFLSAYRDFGRSGRDPFLRYIHRWHLEKADPSVPLSPPRQPIVFWIENTVPVKYREAIREGVLMWNEAFEAVGFQNAIEVRQMPDNADWDPADVRYNTIRWFNSLDATFAMGPSRANPFTGEILDADIVIDANLLQETQQEYETLMESGAPGGQASLRSLCNALSLEDSEWMREQRRSPIVEELMDRHDLCFGNEAALQFALGSLSLDLIDNALPSGDRAADFTHQYLRYIAAHEVGHTLGLRHNFRGSTLLTLEEMNDPAITAERGLASSVMDYLPVNLALPGTPQGDYYPQRIGVYDRWAIAYGYTPFGAANPQAERRDLEAIARRSGEPGLTYATDEDRYGELDPSVLAFDHSQENLRYSQWQLEIAKTLWARLHRRYPAPGESYSAVRDRFENIFQYYRRHAIFISRQVGGRRFSRSYAGDRAGLLPFESVSLKDQKEALKLLDQYVFAADALDFPPDLLNKLAPDRWRDWANAPTSDSLDYPIHDRILRFQSLILRDLLYGPRLERLRDTELKSAPEEALSLVDLFESLRRSIWSEVMTDSEATGAIISTRRSLQRTHLNLLSDMVLRRSSVPEDARTLAWAELRTLRGALRASLRSQKNLDPYTEAHLAESSNRIEKVLAANLESR